MVRQGHRERPFCLSIMEFKIEMKSAVHFTSSISATQFPFSRRSLRSLRPTIQKHVINDSSSTSVSSRVRAERVPTNQDSINSGFDLAHSIALAGCSFEAYRDPNSTYELSQVSTNGTVTSYTNRSHFLTLFE